MQTENSLKPKNSKAYALTGFVLILPTTLFLFWVFLKSFLQLPIFDLQLANYKPVEFIIVFAPLAALIINVLPIMNFNTRLENKSVKFSFELKLNYLNLVVCAVSLCFMIVILTYGVVENLGHYYRGQM